MNHTTPKSRSAPPPRASSADVTVSDDDRDEYMTDDDDGGDYDSGYDSAPPFLPLEEQNNDGADGNDDEDESADLVGGRSNGGGSGDHSFPRRRRGSSNRGGGGGTARRNATLLLGRVSRYLPNITAKRIVSFLMFSLLGIVFWDALFTPPERRWIKPESSMRLLEWVQGHPAEGLVAIMLVIAFCVVVMVPLGTPLTLGCGYVYRGAYGWKAGVAIATAVSMAGSALGAVVCFLLGRYLMRETVRKWVKKYPLFGAIDIASAEHGLRIMAMLYLTPILPLGPVSYMCGTTSMPLSSFVLAKVAATPLMMLYVFIGASTGALIGKDAAAQVKEIEENEYLIVSGILLSFVMIACITTHVKKELNKILERQQKLKPGEEDGQGLDGATEEAAIEMGMTRRRVA